jgi:hypothetical protein
MILGRVSDCVAGEGMAVEELFRHLYDFDLNCFRLFRNGLLSPLCALSRANEVQINIFETCLFCTLPSRLHLLLLKFHEDRRLAQRVKHVLLQAGLHFLLGLFWQNLELADGFFKPVVRSIGEAAIWADETFGRSQSSRLNDCLLEEMNPEYCEHHH